MWKYGYFVTANRDGMGAKMIDLRIEANYNYWDLFRTCDKMVTVTIYVKDAKGKRHVYSTFKLADRHVYETEHVPVAPDQELYVAFEGVKRKVNSFIPRVIGVVEHYTDKDGQFKENRIMITQQNQPTPKDVFNHRWK